MGVRFDSGTKRGEPSLNSEREFASKDGIRRFAVIMAGSGPSRADFPLQGKHAENERAGHLPARRKPAPGPGWPRKKQEERRLHTLQIRLPLLFQRVASPRWENMHG